MSTIRLNQNYRNYDKVVNAYKNFISVLVNNAVDADIEDKFKPVLNESIEDYCKTFANNDLAHLNENLSDYLLSQIMRYEVHLYDCDEDGNIIEETAIHFNTNNLNLALKRAAEFYRYHSDKHPTVNIFDNEINDYIAEWD